MTWSLGKRSFSRQLLLSVLAVVVIVHIVSVAGRGFNETRRLDRSLEAEADYIASLAASLMALPLRDLNYPVLTSMIEELNENGRLVSARLLDPTGEVIAERSWAGETSDHPQDVVLEVEREIVFNSLGQNEVIGHIALKFNAAGKGKALKRFLILEVFTSAFAIITLFVLLARTAIRLASPLVGLVGAVAKIEQGKLDEAIPSTGRDDEIGHLAKALEHLRDSEREVTLLRRENDIQNRKERSRMIEALSATNDAVILFDELGHPVFRNETARELLWGINDAGKLAEHFAEDGQRSRLQPAILNGSTDDFTLVTTPVAAGPPRYLHIRLDPIRGGNEGPLGCVLIATDVTERVAQRERVDHLARHDDLTSLPNRRSLEERLQMLFSVDNTRVGMILVDLDRFKSINDTHGHPVGDELLRIVADAICETIDAEDLPIRMGGDEFAVVGTGEGIEERLTRYAERLIDRFSKLQKIGEITALTGMSVGLSVVEAAEGDKTSLIQQADLALYEAKRLGKGQLGRYNQDLKKQAMAKVQIEQCLSECLARSNGLTIDCQFQTDIETRRIVGIEALARLRPEGGREIPPSQFVAVAEETGLIGAVTVRVLELAMQTAVTLSKHGFEGRVAVNISPKLFTSNLIELVLDAEMRSGCPPELIEFEITEQALLLDSGLVRKATDQLRAKNYTIALDDFGTGYSSFSYLKKYRFDKLKIDQEITDRVEERPERKRSSPRSRKWRTPSECRWSPKASKKANRLPF